MLKLELTRRHGGHVGRWDPLEWPRVNKPWKWEVGHSVISVVSVQTKKTLHLKNLRRAQSDASSAPPAHSTTTWKPETTWKRHFSPWGPLAFLLFHSPDATYPFLHLGISASRRPNVGPGPAKLFSGGRPASFFWICVACLTWIRVWLILTSSKCHRHVFAWRCSFLETWLRSSSAVKNKKKKKKKKCLKVWKGSWHLAFCQYL